MHSNGIVHRNLKLDSIFCEPWDPIKQPSGPRIKIGDFGFSTNTNVDKETTKLTLGVRHFMAPELVRNPG